MSKTGDSKLYVEDNKVFVQQQEYLIPKYVLQSRKNVSVGIIGGIVYVNSYRFDPKTCKWKYNNTRYYLQIAYTLFVIIGLVAFVLSIIWLSNHMVVHISFKPGSLF